MPGDTSIIAGIRPSPGATDGRMTGDRREAAGRPTRRAHVASLVSIFAIALLLRAALVPRLGIYHPDELFQYLEQAHRLLFGHGIVPWEYREGLRSWLLPLGVVPWMATGNWIAPASSLYLLLPRFAAAVASLAIVASAWAFGRRITPTHGLIAAAVAAIWPELVYFAPHVLSETSSIVLILPAAVALTGREVSRGIAACAGGLLATAAILRLQHGPAEAAFATMALWHRRALVRPFLLGVAAACTASALLDLTMGQTPFGWAVEYVRANIWEARAASFGTAPPWAYAQAIAVSYGVFVWPVLILAALGAARYPILLRTALVNLAVHMAIGHKEYRFVLLTTTIMLVLAAIGTGDAVARARSRFPALAGALPWMALAGWAGASAAIAASGRTDRYAVLHPAALGFFAELRDDPGLCGLATQGLPFSGGGGYTYLHRAVPIFTYAPGEGALLRRETRGFNRLLIASDRPPPGFRTLRCTPAAGDDPAQCLMARDGACDALASTAEVNRALARMDQ